MGEILGKKVHRKLSFFSVKRIDRLSKLFPRKSSQTIERFITEEDIAAFFFYNFCLLSKRRPINALEKTETYPTNYYRTKKKHKTKTAKENIPSIQLQSSKRWNDVRILDGSQFERCFVLFCFELFHIR